MDFAKFVSMLDKQALFFARIDSLGDAFEGIESRINRKAVRIDAEILSEMNGRTPNDILKEKRQRTVVNCWHINENESTAMWQLYLKSGAGIAIQSTYQRLIDALKDSPKYAIKIGTVQYIDYRHEHYLENMLYPYMFKRNSYEHERELRAVITNSEPFKESGLLIPVNLKVLIRNVYVSANSENWFNDLVVSVLHKYGFPDKPVITSSLAEIP
jgi:hypothetical protein